jgi:hypothetical protein
MVKTKRSGNCTCWDFQYYVVWSWLRDECRPGMAEWEARGLVNEVLTKQLIEDGFAHLVPLDQDIIWSVCRSFYRDQATV